MYKKIFNLVLIFSFVFTFNTISFGMDKFLDECLKIAEARNQKLAAASDQIDLADIRITNATRSFFPQVTLQMQNSKGKTALGDDTSSGSISSKEEYNAETYGIKATQPIYEGGGIVYNIKYNKLMKDLAKYNYTKQKEELFAKVKTAYYEYLTLKVEYLALSKAFDEVEELLQKTRVEYKARAISQLDLAEAQNFRDKVENLLENSRINLEFCTQKLIEVVGVNTLEEIPATVSSRLPKDVSEIAFSKQECINLIQTNNIELKIARAQLEMEKSKIKINRAKVHPKIYVDAFYGKTGEAYVTKALELTTQWSVAGKLQWSLWGNSFAASVSSDHTDPTTIVDASKRIETTTVDAQLALVDDLQYFIDAKESKVSLKQTEADLIDLMKNARLSAEKAYNEYIVSLNSVKTLLKELKLKERKLALMRKRNHLYEVQTVALMEEAWEYAKSIAEYTRSLYTNHTSVIELEKLSLMPLR